MNLTSSRSHAIFTITLHHLQNHSTSSLTIVDLAGSERSKNTSTERIIEAGSINKSLMVLGQCIEILRNSKTKPSIGIIPFRQNKLTEILFGNMRDVKANMIVTLNLNMPFEENLSLLRYASIASEIESIPNFGMTRSVSGDTDGISPLSLLSIGSNERIGQLEFMLKEEEYKRLDLEEKYSVIQAEMISQALEMEEKMSEMENMYLNRLVEQVILLESC
jgi:Kinesin motor domain